MNLPDVLISAGVELDNANAAWLLARASNLNGDDIGLAQYCHETEYALQRAASLLDQWFTFGRVHMADLDEGPLF